MVTNYKTHLSKWNSELNKEEKAAHDFEGKVDAAEKKAGRVDLGEALLEIALVVTSITLLTRQRMYWLLGMAFGVLGIAVAVRGSLLR